jgi:hypothetical protein
MADEEEKKKLLAGKQRLAEFRKKKEAEEAKKKASASAPTSTPQNDTAAAPPNNDEPKTEPPTALQSTDHNFSALSTEGSGGMSDESRNMSETTEKPKAAHEHEDNNHSAEHKNEKQGQRVHIPASNSDAELEVLALREQVSCL